MKYKIFARAFSKQETQKEHHTTGWQCSGIRQQFGHEAPTNWDRGVSFLTLPRKGSEDEPSAVQQC
jgi:hypothetical protein